MAPKDQEVTAFCTPKGVFYYKVMPSSLKIAKATYQRAIQTIFDDMLHKAMEFYIDDSVVKSKRRPNDLQDLHQIFDILRWCQLKMNPLKCAFDVPLGKFLGFIVRYRGIEIYQAKIKTVQETPARRNLKELRGLQGDLAYIRRLTPDLSSNCHPFYHLITKDTQFEWDQSCQKAFESIKRYLSKPSVLGALIPSKALILHRAQEKSLGSLCTRENEEGKEDLYIT